MSGTGPIFVLDPGKEQTRGHEALFMNISAAKAVSSLVESTLGPKGMDKMLINQIGVVSTTNDGATILKDIGIEHPSAKAVVGVATSLESTAGDGTTSSVVFTASLLDKAEKLVKKGFYPAVIIKGYEMAHDKALEVLDEYQFKLSPYDSETYNILKNVAITSITGKAPEDHKEHLADVCTEAVLAIEKDGLCNIRTDVVMLADVQKPVSETEVVDGLAFVTKSLTKFVPKQIKNAKIALLDSTLTEKTKVDSKMYVSSLEERDTIIRNQESKVKELAQSIISTGANVLFSTKGISAELTDYFNKHGVFVALPVEDKDIENISYATGGRIVRSPRELTADDLGYADLLETDYKNEGGKTYLRGCKGSKIVTVIACGETLQMADNVGQAIDDALGAIRSAFEDGSVVPGGGASEMGISIELFKYAKTVPGYEQKVIEAYAEALEYLPKRLAINGGLDPIDTLIRLRSMQNENKNLGIDVYTGEVADMFELGVVDPTRVKQNMIKAATEAAVMILRIDDVLRSRVRSEIPSNIDPSHMPSSYHGMQAPQINDRR
ncbi:MAG: thermosome subunit [Methanosarcinaceae archaeon]|nr:thermosome subunit [Methanosarcinaceae archaeon]